MKQEQTFEVAAPLNRVWAALVDVPRIARCLPGAALGEVDDSGAYPGEFKVRIGPTSAAYSGTVSVESIDSAAHVTTLYAAGTDKRGQGGANARIMVTASANGEQSTGVLVASEYQITGRLARFGRAGTIEEIGTRLVAEFAEAFASLLATLPEPEAEPDPEPVAEPDVVSVPGQEPLAAEQPADASADAAVTDATAEPIADHRATSEPVPEPEPAAGGTGTDPEPRDEPQPARATPIQGPVRPAPSAWVEPSTELTDRGLLSRAIENPVPTLAVLFGLLVVLRILRRRG